MRLHRSKVNADGRKGKRPISQIKKDLTEYLPVSTVQFITSQLEMSQRKKKGCRWSHSDKMLALSIFYQSQKAYQIFGKLFHLPSKNTLKRTLQKMNIWPGFSPEVFSTLKSKVESMRKEDKACAVIFDEMSLKEALNYDHSNDCIVGMENFGDLLPNSHFVANHALVFVIRGLCEKWKQPLGYVVTSGPVRAQSLNVLLLECLDRILETGLSPKVIICDQGSNNRSLIDSILKVSIDKPYFCHKGNTIYVLYDPPHLLKNIRNNFKKNAFVYEGTPILWDYVKTLYEIDKVKKIRQVPKLTSKHVEIPAFSTMNVRLAAQVLSHSVAASMSTLSSLKLLPQAAETTALFIEQFDTMFNAFNSRTLKSSQRQGHAISEVSGHIAFLSECLLFLEKVALSGGKRKLPCLQGWKLSINALIGLWKDLRINFGYKFLLTNRLNQDCVENLFSIIRGKGGYRDNPDCEQFRAAFRYQLCEKLFIKSDSSNCKVDMDKILIDIVAVKKTSQCQTEKVVTSHVPSVPTIPVESIQQGLDLSTQNASTYVAGYLLRKKMDTSACNICHSLLFAKSGETDDDRYMFIRNKSYNELGDTGLNVPSVAMCELVDIMTNVFVVHFPYYVKGYGLLTNLVSVVKEQCLGLVKCENKSCVENMLLMASLFMKIKMYHELKSFSSSTPGRRNRKLLKLSHL